VTELCEEALSSKLRRLKSEKAKFDSVQSDMLKWMLEVASGLACLHHKNIVHGDLKPANVLLDEGGTAKLCDFGLATKMSSSELSFSIGLGTASYMAPELFGSSKGMKKPAVDIWAFGCTCWAMCALQDPFEDLQPSIFWIQQFLQSGKRLTIPEECPPAIHAIIDDCWNMEEQERPNILTIQAILREVHPRHSLYRSFVDFTKSEEQRKISLLEEGMHYVGVNVLGKGVGHTKTKEQCVGENSKSRLSSFEIGIDGGQ